MLFLRTQELLVWEPITGAQRRIPVPELFEAISVCRNTLCGTPKEMYPGAAVFCAADGCDHRGHCHGDSFGLALVFTDFSMADPYDDKEFEIWVCVFSSETGMWEWDKLSSMIRSKFCMEFTSSSGVLVGSSLLYFMCDDEVILEYDLARHGMTVIKPPNYRAGQVERFNIMRMEDGGLGVGEYLDPNLKLWTREATDDADAQWVLSRVISLGNLVPIGAPLYPDDCTVQVRGFAEGANVIFLTTVAGLFTVGADRGFCNLIPVVSFYTPVPRGEHQDLPSLGPSEEAGGDW
jgi:hypothetical protein